MLSVMRPLVAIVLYLTLSVLAFSQSTPASVPGPEVIYGATSVEWPASVSDAPVLLTVSGPAGLYIKQENPAGTWRRFSLVNEQGQVRPDGVYKWELVSQAGSETPGEINQVQSGWFEIQNGKVIAEGIGEKQPLVVEEQAPASSLFVDSQGRVGLGTSVPASQLHLKGILPAVTLEDTTTGGGLFTWRGLEKGDGALALFDKGGQARWLVDSEGRIGIGTTKPTSALTVDGYIEATKGFLVNGKPIGAGFGLIGGAQPLYTEGGSNNFFGTGAGAVTTGTRNSFFGNNAGHSNATGSGNTFFGFEAGYSNTTAVLNAFFGDGAGRATTIGDMNAFFGAAAGDANTTGTMNSFFGTSAGAFNTTGFDNSFFGIASGFSNTVECGNAFIGARSNGSAGVTNATALGYKAQVSASDSLVLGSIAGLNEATSYVNVGIGTPAPARQLHLAGPNAVFRMDRPSDTAAFLLVRTDPTGATPWKAFVVGTNATDENQGEFIINDIGAAVGGGGNRRMTISNEGDVTFTGNVYATSFTPTSSLAFKTNIRTFENALETVNRLRGVRFDWKDSGKPAVGLIAEEVNEVVPEVVALEGGKARGVNYDNLVAVLVEAVKEQQKTIDKQQKTNEEQQQTIQHERTTNAAQQAELDSLKAEVETLKALLQRR